MACWPWVVPWRNQGQDIEDFPNIKAWYQRVIDRPAAQKGFSVGAELRRGGLQASGKAAEEARKVLFGQRAR
jgi:GST-like protein